jgi:hypothetical protein
MSSISPPSQVVIFRRAPTPFPSTEQAAMKGNQTSTLPIPLIASQALSVGAVIFFAMHCFVRIDCLPRGACGVQALKHRLGAHWELRTISLRGLGKSPESRPIALRAPAKLRSFLGQAHGGKRKSRRS